MRHINTQQTGLSLVELMVAITIGLVVSGAVATIFIQSKASYSQNDEINFLQDNGRYVLNTLADDLEQAGFYGGLISTISVIWETDPTVDDYLIGAPNIECGPATRLINSVASWTYDASSPLNYLSASAFDSDAALETAVATNFPCIAGYQDDSNFLTIKRVRGNPITATASLEPNKVYLYGNLDDGIFHTSTVALPSNQTAWEYYVNLYYINDNTLKKMYLGYDHTNSRFAMYEADLGQGIENFRILFGIGDANNNDPVVQYYTSSPSAAELSAAVTARIYVLARGSKEMHGYTNDKSYQLGDLTVSYASDSDSYYRRVFSTSVVLRNIVNMKLHNN